VLEHKSSNISETRRDRGKVTIRRANRNSPTLFRTVLASQTPYGLLPQDWGLATPTHRTLDVIIPGTVKLYELQILYAHS